MFPQVLRAGQWFLRSGIQHTNGGVARYYRLDRGRNEAVSTEITGYAASALVFLAKGGGGPEMELLEGARRAARFLCDSWDGAHGAMPFEVDPARFTYFFDCGIIVRGLLAVWRATGEQAFFDGALRVGQSMAHDFRAEDGGFHPILTLPGKRPLERDALRWSRSRGCYQLKAAMAWWDLWEATGDVCWRELYLGAREEAARSAPEFLPGHPEGRKVVDRLHAYVYFLEGLLPMPSPAMEEGIELVARLLRELAPEFERSDVYAQLLRIRVFADTAGVVKLDRAAAEWEAQRLAEFAREDGGFYFGRSGGAWEPYVNPVSAAFALQALALWGGGAPADRHLLI